MAIARIETAAGRVVCEHCLVADRWWLRMRGLLGRSELDPAEGILLRPAGSIHMMFMRFTIDAIFCDRELLVVGVVRGLKPWRAAGKRGAKVVIELADGAAAGVEPGDQLSLATIDR
jgi:uncharacterized protein